jgi:hypothetical protein
VAQAGLAGALVFLLFSMIYFVATGKGFWTPVNLIAHTIDRGAPLDGRFSLSALVIGFVSTAVVATLALVPIVVAAYGEGMHPLLFIAGAAVYANVLWIFGHYLFWANIDPAGAKLYNPGVSWIGHILAGAAAGAVMYPVMKRGYEPVERKQPDNA